MAWFGHAETQLKIIQFFLGILKFNFYLNIIVVWLMIVVFS